ncbi:MAG: ABC transporter ATP-binding protein [Acidimicrobiales bacterium]
MTRIKSRVDAGGLASQESEVQGIHAEGLTRRFGGRAVVEDVSFDVAPGEVVGFLGPNGAGKTTTMRLLLGLLRPDAGHAHVGPRCGYLPETNPAYEPMTVGAYLRFVSRIKRVAAAEVARVAGLADLGPLLARPIGRLSRGQRQRVGLAQALLGDPSVLILDEPTQGLDPRQVVDARAVVRAAAETGAAVLLSTHLLAEAASMCDRVIVIVKGRIVAEERPGGAADLEARFLELVGRGELS